MRVRCIGIFLIASALLASGCGGSKTKPDLSGLKRVFVTSVQYPATFGGLAKADEACMLAVSAANLGGSWKAWLSDSNTDAIDRMADVGPWYLVFISVVQSGDLPPYKVFNNKANLKTTPLLGINVSEKADTVKTGECVWTATTVGGTKTSGGANATCQDWTQATTFYGGVGSVGYSNGDWTASASSTQSGITCSSRCHLYCFEQ